MERPDLSQAEPAVRAYIEWLEAQLEGQRASRPDLSDEAEPPLPPLEPDEPPTTLNVITLTRSGLAKRTPRHRYSRQRRGGMGVFDVESGDDDPPQTLAIADERANLLVITSHARALRLPVYFLDEVAVRARPQPYMVSLPLQEGEAWSVALPIQAQGYLAIVSRGGFVRTLPAHLFGDTMREGMTVFKVDEAGPPAAACWAPGDGDVFIVTRHGLGVRFPVKTVPGAGGPGIRVNPGDEVVGAAGVRTDDGVLLVTEDGRGTIRLMSGFTANKAPGAGGKVALKGEGVIGAATARAGDNVFILSRLSKIIRFKADEIPAKDGVVQGVNCMGLRGDACVALAVSGP
jgi:DNA gyrase subunit A